VLSLFFIDRVANYAPVDGKIRRWFEEIYQKLAANPLYQPLSLPLVELVHNGYFAQNQKGVPRTPVYSLYPLLSCDPTYHIRSNMMAM